MPLDDATANWTRDESYEFMVRVKIPCNLQSKRQLAPAHSANIFYNGFTIKEAVAADKQSVTYTFATAII